jgi:hypothetical protein
VEPQLGIAKQIERHEYHLLIVRRQVHMEEPFAVIQPWHGVAGAVELRKFHLVGSGVGVVAGIPCIIIPSAPSGMRRRTRAARCTLCHLNPVDGVLQFLLMAILVGHRSLQRLDACREWLQRL